MKSTEKIYEQEARIYELLRQNTKRQILAVHPETDSLLILVNNWGNPEAKKIAERHRNYEHMIFNISKDAYQKAFKIEYPEHTQSK